MDVVVLNLKKKSNHSFYVLGQNTQKWPIYETLYAVICYPTIIKQA